MPVLKAIDGMLAPRCETKAVFRVEAAARLLLLLSKPPAMILNLVFDNPLYSSMQGITTAKPDTRPDGVGAAVLLH